MFLSINVEAVVQFFKVRRISKLVFFLVSLICFRMFSLFFFCLKYDVIMQQRSGKMILWIQHHESWKRNLPPVN